MFVHKNLFFGVKRSLGAANIKQATYEKNEEEEGEEEEKQQQLEEQEEGGRG